MEILKNNTMPINHIIFLINTLYLLATFFGFYQENLYLLYFGAILAAVSLWFHSYKNIMINRPMLIIYLCTILIALMNLIPSHILLPLYFAPFMLYVLVVGIGIYTTFSTEAGFVGVTGKDKKVIKKASLVLLSAVIISPLFIIIAMFQEFPRNLTPFFVIAFIYEAARRYAADAQRMYEVE